MRKLIRYLFPPIRNKQRLPLLPLDYSSTHSRHGDIPDDVFDKLYMIKGYGLARTDQDAYRLLRKYQGQPIQDIVKAEKRKRRRQGRLARAWQRLKRLW